MTAIAPIARFGKPGRHKWGNADRYPYKTECTCEVCGITKVTRHEPSVHPWLEFWRDGVFIQRDRTPACVPLANSPICEGVGQ